MSETHRGAGEGPPSPEEPRYQPEDPSGVARPAGDRPAGGERSGGPSEPEGAARHEQSGPGADDHPAPAGAGEEDAARIAELEDRWRRAVADLDNYRKRTARALDQERGAERARTSALWLPVLDNLERALEHADAEPGAVIEGVRSVLEQAREVIGRLGYPRQDDEGAPFDPARHEAVGVTPADVPEGTIVRVLTPGYGEGERLLRPARVVVAKGHDDGAAP